MEYANRKNKVTKSIGKRKIQFDQEFTSNY